MKGIFKYIAAAAATMLFAIGCTPEILSPDQSKLPEASKLEVVITPDQTTNYVTFSVANAQGLVPLWIFGEEKIDGKENKTYAYTGNDIVLRIREAGTHKVEVKAYNANGISVGSVTKEFTLENTYIDPFDPSPYIKNFAGSGSVTWEWRYSVDGHFGCGQSPDNPTNWWSSKKEEKNGVGLYDDRITFTSDGKYTYSPGEDGKVYVNWESGYMPELWSGVNNEDYAAPIEEFTTTYAFERSWNDAGIEEVYLVFPAGTNVSYIPSQYALDNPRYLVVKSTAALMSLVHTNPDVISWKYEFVPEGGNDVEGPTINENPFPADLTVKKGDVLTIAGLDADAAASMWVDPDFLYHDGAALRFKAIDGDYRFEYDAGANWVKVMPLVKGELATYDTGKALWIIGDNAGKPSDQKLIGWTPENALPMARISENTYQITLAVKAAGGSFKIFGQAAWEREFTSGNHTTTDLGLFHITNGSDGGDDGNIYANDGVADGFYTMTVTDADGTLTASITPYPAVLDAAAETNLWKNAAIDISTWFANQNWEALASQPNVTAGDNNYTLTAPDGMGTDQWMGQVSFNNTGLSTAVGKTYDFGIVLNSTEDHPGATIKLTKQTDDKVYYVAGRHALKAGEDYVYSVTGMPGIDIDALQLVLDFGGAVAGSTITIKDIVLVER